MTPQGDFIRLAFSASGIEYDQDKVKDCLARAMSRLINHVGIEQASPILNEHLDKAAMRKVILLLATRS